MSAFVRPAWFSGFFVLALMVGAPAMAQDSPAAKAPAVGILTVRPRTLNFNNLNLKKHSAKSKYIIVKNTGRSTLQINFGTTQTPFAVACSCTQVSLPPHKEVGVLIAFQPDSDGSYSGTFDIESNGGGNKPPNVVVNLRGRATGTPPTSSSSVSGTVTGSQKPVSNATVNLMAAGDDTSGTGSSLLFSTTTDSQGRF